MGGCVIADPLNRRAMLRAGGLGVLGLQFATLALAAAGGPFHPEDFGAKGDGATDDTLAFQALGRAVSKLGGGTILLRPRATYRLGRQARGGVNRSAAFVAQPMLRLAGVSGVAILGNGATLKLNDGLHYGSFDPATGRRFDPPKGKFTDQHYAASVGALVEIRDARGVRIEDLVLDGNVERLVVGGRWNVDIQLHADGLQLVDVSEISIRNVIARNNGLDGVYLRGRGRSQPAAPSDAIRFAGLRCDRNGRQGVSIVGGAGVRFDGCTFANTGQGPIDSAPGAGVDIEPNGRDWASDIAFERCTFVNNVGVGLLAAEGASRGITVSGSTFWQGFVAHGSVSRGSGDAFWLTKTGVTIADCTVHGTVTNLGASAMVARTNFDDAVHPTYGRAAQRRRYILSDVGGTFTDCTVGVSGDTGQGLIYATKPVTYRRCTFRYAGGGLPASRAAAFLGAPTTLDDVTFTEALPKPVPGGHYIYDGHPILRGRVEVTGPDIRWGSSKGPVGDIAALSRK